MTAPDELWLIHPHPDACEAFAHRFAGLPNVRVVESDYAGLAPHDCFVTAGNSFGQMSAGIDRAVAARFGEGFVAGVQARILDDYLGEQPVGTAFVQPTGDADRPFVCHAPTMRVPGSIDGTDKVYAATWAALLAVYRHNALLARGGGTDGRIATVAMPAMGTGFGGVAYDEAARQMAVAYAHALHPPHRLDWDVVADRQRAICYDGGRLVVRRS